MLTRKRCVWAMTWGLVAISLVPGAQVDFTVVLDGAQAANGQGTGSGATGSGTLTLDTERGRLDWNIKIDPTLLEDGPSSATVGQIRRGTPGRSGPVITAPGDIPVLGGQLLFGTATLDPEDLGDFVAGALYLNIPTSAFANGEIRGQIVPQRLQMEAQRDNTLFEDDPGALSNGAGEHFFVGRIKNGARRRGLLFFDVSGVGIPPGAKISQVTLHTHMSRSIAGEQTTHLHRVQADWGEGTSDASGVEGKGAPSSADDATWLHRFFSTDLWDTAGGDYTESPSASQQVGGVGPYTWDSNQVMLNDVQLWVDHPNRNHGWILVGNEAVTTTAKRFDTRENATVENRPQLVIKYAPPCPFELAGDLNGDCKVDFLDLAILTNNWQIDCQRYPLDPACVTP